MALRPCASEEQNRGGTIPVGDFHSKTAVVNATGASQPLVPAQRVPGIITLAAPRLTVRDLLPSYPATSNLIEVCQGTSGYQQRCATDGRLTQLR